MAKITVFGAGITGMAIASQLPRSCDITVVARDLPGDAPSGGWSSPWACAGWVALWGSPREQQMQLDALNFFAKLAVSYPESSVRRATLTCLHDVAVSTTEELWYRNRVPDFEVLDPRQFPGNQVEYAVQYTSYVLTPSIFLPWLRGRLEATGVRFLRIPTVQSLTDLKYLGHDLVVNASGLASLTLTDVQDLNVTADRTYTVLVRSNYNGMFVRRSATEYTYIFGRQDGTAVLGGISDPVRNQTRSADSVRSNLIRRAHENLPEYFPSGNIEDYSVVEDLVGIRPLRLPEVRVERDSINGQNVLHAYGTTAGGYIYSFGIARRVVSLLEESLFKT